MSIYMTRGCSPYIAFCNAKRDEVRANNPTIAFGDTGRILWSLWKNMSESEKAVYVNLRSQPTLQNYHGPRRSNRLKNKHCGVDFFGCKLKN
jgi:hypothetical protein